MLGWGLGVMLGVWACGSGGEVDDEGEIYESSAGSGGGGAGGKAGKGGKGGKSEVDGGSAGFSGDLGVGGEENEAGASGDGGEAGSSGEAGAAGSSVEVKGAPYPIVLAHGFFGFEKFAGLNFISYFYKVKDRLNAEGELEVYTPPVDPFNNSELRAQALLKQVEAIVLQTGRGKVNLVGHSQGGLDARVVATLRPDLVASVTTFATPHRGTKVADVALGLMKDENAQKLIDELVKIVGIPLYDSVGNQTSLSKSLVQLSTKSMEAFNEKYPDQPGILYQSLTGRSKDHLGGSDCASSDEPAFVKKTHKWLDGLEPLLTVPGMILDGIDLLPAPHDGLVPVKSARWGQFLGCVPADHFDEIGHLFGDKPSLLNGWDYLDFYVELVRLLRQKGL